MLLSSLVLLLVPLVAVGGYLIYLNRVVTTNLQHSDLLPERGPGAVAGPTAGPSADVVPAESAGQNYLLIGSDAREGLGGARSDVIILVHVPEDHQNVQLIHFPRDLYVDIPGHPKQKINAAFAFGGAPLLVQTMQNLLGIRIDHVGIIGFEGFKRMTDAVGGVDVVVEESSVTDGHVFTQGTQHINGDEALAFVRERYQLSEGDISRGRRQQAVLKALMLKALSKETLTNPAQLARFVDAATANLTVDKDLQVDQMRAELFAMRDLRAADIRFITAPFTGFASIPGVGSVDLVDSSKMTALGAAIRADTLDSFG